MSGKSWERDEGKGWYLGRWRDRGERDEGRGGGGEMRGEGVGGGVWGEMMGHRGRGESGER